MLLRSLRAHRNTPWQFTDLDRFQYPLAGDIDDRHIVGQTVGDQQKFFVGSEGTMPDPLSDKEVLTTSCVVPSTTATRLAGPRCTKPNLPSRVMLIPTGWMVSDRNPCTENLTIVLIFRVAGSMIDSPPPTSDVTQSSEPSLLKAAERG